MLRAAITSFSGAKEPVHIDGQAARVRVHVDDPVLYVSLDTGNKEEIAPEDAVMVNTHGASSVKDKDEYSSPDSRYAIVRVDVRPGERVIGAVRISRAGSATQSADIVPTHSEILTGRHWMKLTPKEPLPIGEYAFDGSPHPRRHQPGRLGFWRIAQRAGEPAPDYAGEG